MNKQTKIAILAVIVVATVAGLFFYGFGSKQKVSAPTIDDTQGVSRPIPKPQANTNVSQTLEPLPADNKQAISGEIQNIEKELQAADTSLSADTADEELGL